MHIGNTLYIDRLPRFVLVLFNAYFGLQENSVLYIKYISAIILVLFLAACSGEESAAKNAVLVDLKDPDSAKFGDFQMVGRDGACLEVNARNSFGGYTGATYMSLIKIEGEWAALTDSGSLDICTKVVTEIIKRHSGGQSN